MMLSLRSSLAKLVQQDGDAEGQMALNQGTGESKFLIKFASDWFPAKFFLSFKLGG